MGPGWRMSWWSHGCDRAVALVVDVGAVGGAPGLVVEQHPEPCRRPWPGRSHDEVEVAGVEPVEDPPLGLVEHDGLSPYRPVAGQGPLVEGQPRGDGIAVRGVQDRTVGGEAKFSVRS